MHKVEFQAQPETTFENLLASLKIVGGAIQACQTYWAGVFKYTNEFMLPYWTALNAFGTTESDKLLRHPPDASARDYGELLLFNLQVFEKACASSSEAMNAFHSAQASRILAASLGSLAGPNGVNELARLVTCTAQTLDQVVYRYPQAIEDIATEYGFHFESGGYVKADETDRFLLYQVLPKQGIRTRENGKPVLIIPPYVLGANILALLPGEDKSYVHAFANQGIPTYIRILKDIDTTPAVQTLTGEEDILDIARFGAYLMRRHGRRTTLNGFCQGGLIAVSGLLTGELDDCVDALVNCVAPMDGTRSKALVEYMQHLPPRFRDLGYAVKGLPNGNRVVDGKVMSWVYKLKSMEKEAPLYTFFQDLMRFERNCEDQSLNISKTAAALNRWLLYDRSDLPVDITRLSFESYTRPVTADGSLPFKLFHRELNFKRLEEKKLPFLICYGKSDELVDSAAALAPLDFVNAEVTGFPKGHGAIATSWSNPSTAYALHKRYEDGSRGPVRFQLDLEETTD